MNRLEDFFRWLVSNLMFPITMVAQALIFGTFVSTGFVDVALVIMFAAGVVLAGMSLASAEGFVEALRKRQWGRSLALFALMAFFIGIECMASLSDRGTTALTSLDNIIIATMGLPANPLVHPLSIIIAVVLPLATVAIALEKSYKEKPSEHSRTQNIPMYSSSQPENGIPERSREHSQNTRTFLLGTGEQGPVHATIQQMLSVSIVGKPGRGKTTLLLSLASQARAMGYEVLCFDPHYSLKGYSDTQGFLEGVDKLRDIFTERRRELAAYGAVKALPLLVLIDEFPVVSELGGEEVLGMLKSVILEGRKFNMYAVVSGQGLPATLFGSGASLVRDMFSTRFFFDVSDEQARMAKLDKTGFPLLPRLRDKKGVAILDMDSSRGPQVVTIPMEQALEERGTVGTFQGTEEEQIVEHFRNGVPKSRIHTKMGKGASYYPKVQRVLEEAQLI